MGRIKIKIKNTTDGNEIKIRRISSSNNIYATRIQTTFESFTAMTSTDADLDKVVNRELTR